MILYNIILAKQQAVWNIGKIIFSPPHPKGNITAEALLHDKLNLETARIHWQELQPHFARGAAVYVDSHLDLIGIAKLMADDDSATLAKLMQQGQFGVVSETQARQFLADNQAMWAVVVAPWVLVQPCQD